MLTDEQAQKKTEQSVVDVDRKIRAQIQDEADRLRADVEDAEDRRSLLDARIRGDREYLAKLDAWLDQKGGKG